MIVLTFNKNNSVLTLGLSQKHKFIFNTSSVLFTIYWRSSQATSRTKRPSTSETTRQRIRLRPPPPLVLVARRFSSLPANGLDGWPVWTNGPTDGRSGNWLAQAGFT